MVFANTKESRPLKSRNFFHAGWIILAQNAEMTHTVIAKPFRVSLLDLRAFDVEFLDLLDRTKKQSTENLSRPQRQAIWLRVVDIYRRAATQTIAAARSDVAVAKAIAFLLGHEISHIVFDSSKLDMTSSARDRELRADFLGLIVNDIARIREEMSVVEEWQHRPGMPVSVTPDRLVALTSEHGSEVFLNIYNFGKFSEGDDAHGSISYRLQALRKYLEEWRSNWAKHIKGSETKQD